MPWRMTRMLCCPMCRSGLDVMGISITDGGVEEGTLRCTSPTCGMAFPVRNGIPDMVPAHLVDDAAWDEWEVHLDQFQRRRELRIEDAGRLTSRIHVKKRGLQRAFAAFTGITRGVVLDVGCGPGKLRFNFNPATVDYYGVDPTPLPEATTFPYARAVAEFIPYKDEQFSDVIVVSALDHFRDLDAFFTEVSRVLEPDGRLHVVQSVHDSANPIKLATHWLKDVLEDQATRSGRTAAPHHMHEFTRSSFLERVSSLFTVFREKTYARNWYSPNKLFLTLARR